MDQLKYYMANQSAHGDELEHGYGESMH